MSEHDAADPMSDTKSDAGPGPLCEYSPTIIEGNTRCRAVPRASQKAHPSVTRYLKTLDCLEASLTDNETVSWLDLGCGDGRWLERLAQNKRRRQSLSCVRFVLLDFDPDQLESCAERIGRLAGEEAQIYMVVADLNNSTEMERELRDVQGFPFDHVSMINCLHELDPYQVPDLLLSLISCTKPGGGTIHIADHDPLDEIELGALPWPQDLACEFLAMIAERHEGLRPDPDLDRMLKIIHKKKPPAIHAVWERTNETPANPAIDAAFLRNWIREKLPGFRSMAEENLLNTWKGYLEPDKAGPSDKAQKEIVTEFMRLVSSHFHLAHRIQEN